MRSGFVGNEPSVSAEQHTCLLIPNIYHFGQRFISGIFLSVIYILIGSLVRSETNQNSVKSIIVSTYT